MGKQSEFRRAGWILGVTVLGAIIIVVFVTMKKPFIGKDDLLLKIVQTLFNVDENKKMDDNLRSYIILKRFRKQYKMYVKHMVLDFMH